MLKNIAGKFILCNILIILNCLIINIEVQALAWTRPKNQVYNALGLMRLPSYKNYLYGNIGANSYSVANKTSSYGVSNYLEFGVNDDLTTIFDITQYKKDDILQFQLGSDITEISFNYRQFSSYIGAIYNISSKTNSSIYVILAPMDYYFSDYGNSYNKKKSYLSLGAAYGRGFDYDTLHSFIDISLDNRFFYSTGHISPGIEIKYGLDNVAYNLSTVVVLNGRFNQVSYNKKTYQSFFINYIDTLQGYSSNQIMDLRQSINRYFQQHSYNNNIELQLKVSCNVYANKDIELGWFTDISNGRVSKNGVLKLSIVSSF